MGTTEPIRDNMKLEQFKDYYRTQKPNPRNYALIILGLHTALRIGDILQLQWKDVYDFEHKQFREHLCIVEHKTDKPSSIAMCKEVKQALSILFNGKAYQPDDYIFSKTTDHSTPFSRTQAYRIVRSAAENTASGEHISCHSLRKTFGYHAFKQGVPPAMLMDIYNHSSFDITKRYLGITQDERDDIFLGVKL